MAKKQQPKAYYCEIPVADEDIERFKKGCAHYNMTCTQKRGKKPYWTVGTDDIVDLYWLGANICGKIPDTPLTKHKF